MKPRTLIALVIMTYCLAPTAEATVRRVKTDATGTPHDGSTWNQAYTDLQSAITDSSAGDEVWVAYMSATPYTPGTSVSDTFSLKNGVAVYGGFVGNESTLNDRDYQANETILSGEIGAAGSSDNCNHVVTANGTSSTLTRLDGFTIRDGYGSNSPSNTSRLGAGIFITGNTSSPQVVNCTFEDNQATLSSVGQGGGAAVRTDSGQPVFQDCTFRDNSATNQGGAIAVSGESPTSIRIEGCTFEGNMTTATSGTTAFYGGGAVYVDPGSTGGAFSLQITDCIFRNNETSFVGGGAVGVRGARGTMTIRGCLFEENVSNNHPGGGLFVASGADPLIVNCVFLRNQSVGSAGTGGGGEMPGSRRAGRV